MTALGITVAVLGAVLAPSLIRASMVSGLRALFIVGVGSTYLAVAGAILAWQQAMTPTMLSATGFGVVGWLLVLGARFWLALRYHKEYGEYQRQTNLLQRLAGRSPRFFPPFPIDARWLLGGLGSAGVALLLTLTMPSQLLLVWGSALSGALMMIVRIGAFGDVSVPDGG